MALSAQRLPQRALSQLGQRSTADLAHHHAQRERAQFVVVVAHALRLLALVPARHHPCQIGSGLEKGLRVDGHVVALMQDGRATGHVAQVAQRGLAVQRTGKLVEVLVGGVVVGGDQAPVETDAQQQRTHALGHRPAGQAHVGLAAQPVTFVEDLPITRHQQAGDGPALHVLGRCLVEEAPAVTKVRHQCFAPGARLGCRLDDTMRQHAFIAARVIAHARGGAAIEAFGPAGGIALLSAPGVSRCQGRRGGDGGQRRSTGMQELAPLHSRP